MKFLKIQYLPFLILGIIMALMSGITEWMSDSIVYQYIIPWGGGDPAPSDKIENLNDIFVSQYNHYWYANGRYFVHVLVQLFCALLGKYFFAVCNGVVWFFLPYTCLKAARVPITLRTSVITSALLVFLLYYLRPDPPFQINYVWMALMSCGFLLIFFGRYSCSLASLILTALYSCLYGEGNEGFSFTTGVGIIVYAVMRKFRLERHQWIAAISFGIGTIVQFAAPGNWARFSKMEADISALTRIETLIPALILPLIYICTVLLIANKGKGEKGAKDAYSIFLWGGVAGGCLLCLVLKGGVGARMLIPANLYLLILLLRRLKENDIKVPVCILSSIFAVLILAFEMKGDIDRSQFDRRMYDAYCLSADGIVYVPDKEFADNILRLRSNTAYSLHAASLYPGKGKLRVRPQALRNVSELPDTNMAVRISNNGWMILQSKNYPNEFIVRKTLLPGILNKSMADRHLDLSPQGADLIDSTDNLRIGVYVNPRDYLDAEIEIK